eukprot:353199-Chlamydomonas_euryale.AAC.1
MMPAADQEAMRAVAAQLEQVWARGQGTDLQLDQVWARGQGTDLQLEQVWARGQGADLQLEQACSLCCTSSPAMCGGNAVGGGEGVPMQ